MGNAVTILGNWFKEFIPALKLETIIVGVSLMVMSLCLMEVAETSGLSGRLMYLALHPGLTAPGFFGGLALVLAAMFMKPVPRELM